MNIPFSSSTQPAQAMTAVIESKCHANILTSYNRVRCLVAQDSFRNATQVEETRNLELLQRGTRERESRGEEHHRLLSP